MERTVTTVIFRGPFSAHIAYGEPVSSTCSSSVSLFSNEICDTLFIWRQCTSMDYLPRPLILCKTIIGSPVADPTVAVANPFQVGRLPTKAALFSKCGKDTRINIREAFISI